MANSAPTTPQKVASGDKTFSNDFMTCLVASLMKANGGAITLDYKNMSKLSTGNENLTTSAIEHRMRPIKKAASELLAEKAAEIEAGAIKEVTPPKKRAAATKEDTPATPTPKKAKTTKKAKAEKVEPKIEDKVKNEPSDDED